VSLLENRIRAFERESHRRHLDASRLAVSFLTSYPGRVVLSMLSSVGLAAAMFLLAR